MMEICLEWIAIKRFRSFAYENFAFPKTQGLRLLGGDNQEQPRLGANGVGKTSLLDAICWCFYGRSIKGAKTSELISWGEKDTDVECQLRIGDRQHLIRRYGPPMRITLDGQPVEQAVIDSLLHLSYKRFLHSIIFGQAVSLFPDLSIPERGELFDEVLNLKVWTDASDAAATTARELETLALNEQRNLSFLQGQVSQLETDEQVQARIEKWEQDKQQRVGRFIKLAKEWDDKHVNELEEIKTWIEEWDKNRLDYVEERIQEVDKLEKRSSDILAEQLDLNVGNGQAIADAMKVLDIEKRNLDALKRQAVEIESERKHVVKPRSFWEANDACPTCGSPITPTTKQKNIKDIETKEHELLQQLYKVQENVEKNKEIVAAAEKVVHDLQIEKAQNDVKWRGLQTEWDSITARMNQIENELSKEIQNPYEAQLKEAENETNPYETEIVHADEERCPILDELEQLRSRRNELQVQIEEKQTSIRSIQSKQVAVEYWKQGFKRIRLYFVNQILAALELEIQSAISQLGLEGWRVKLSTESETKSGTVKLGIAIRIYSPKAEGAWEVWSGGESQRLRLAIALGLSSLIQRAAGVWFKTCIFDEPTTWLSSEGIEDLIEALQGFAEVNGKAVWLLDHRALFHGGFAEVWNVVKYSDGAKIVRVR